MSFPLTDVQSYGLFLESVFYGVYLVTCGFCAQALFTTQQRLRRCSELNWAMIIVMSTIFAIATVDVVLQFFRNLRTFATADGPGDATKDFTNISDPINVVKTATVLFQTVIADGMLIYRCWEVYNRSWFPITLSLLLWLGGVAITGVLFYLEITQNTHTLLTIVQLKPFGAAFWVMTIVVNIITTALIVVRIWRVDRDVGGFRYNSSSQSQSVRPPSRLQRVIRIVVESGLMYTVAALITFITFTANSIAVYVATDLIIQVVGIAFNLIIIRSAQPNPPDVNLTDSHSGNRYPLQFVRTDRSTVVCDPVQHINVEVTRKVDEESQAADDIKPF
ncbi:hypothetical protein B0H10DRAFT_1985979 [Mycena sp. CBHHK59/15]|nr:hypothetical protein B0H10DRAFT_1985979 [Mycena sp. CBHHK59/15]